MTSLQSTSTSTERCSCSIDPCHLTRDTSFSVWLEHTKALYIFTRSLSLVPSHSSSRHSSFQQPASLLPTIPSSNLSVAPTGMPAGSQNVAGWRPHDAGQSMQSAISMPLQAPVQHQQSMSYPILYRARANNVRIGTRQPGNIINIRVTSSNPSSTNLNRLPTHRRSLMHKSRRPSPPIPHHHLAPTRTRILRCHRKPSSRTWPSPALLTIRCHRNNKSLRPMDIRRSRSRHIPPRIPPNPDIRSRRWLFPSRTQTTPQRTVVRCHRRACLRRPTSLPSTSNTLLHHSSRNYHTETRDPTGPMR